MPATVDALRIAGALALLTLGCGTGTITPPAGAPPPPNGPANRAPEVTVAPNATTAPVVEGQTTQLSVTADDPDGDSLAYAWTQISPATPQGTFSARTIRNPGWTAPAVTADTVFTFQVSIGDGQGGSTSGTLQLTVRHVIVNGPPVVSSIMVTPAMPVAGDVVTLAITATDPDADPLTIAWSQTAPSTQGAFSATDRASVTWISPPLSVSTLDFSFQVTVTDGHNPLQTRTVTVPVKTPAYVADVQPIWNAQCTSCHPASAQLDLTAPNSYGQLVNVAQTSGGPCASQKRVDTTAPASSSLLGWLDGSCGTRMPDGGQLSAGALVKVQSWVLSGAAP